MKRLWAWMFAKRKWLFSILVIVTVAVMTFAGKMDAVIGVSMLVLAAGTFGLGDQVERHTAQLTQVLEDLAKAGVNVTVHNYGGAEKSAIQAARDGIKLAESIKADEKTGNS